MSKSKRSNRSRPNQSGRQPAQLRDAFIATPRVEVLPDWFDVTPRPRTLRVEPETDLAEVEDNRRFHPTTAIRYPMRTTAQKAVRSTPRPSLLPTYQPPPSGRIQPPFQAQETVIRCVRRHTRERVLHATGKTGTGKRRGRTPPSSEWC